MVLRYIRTQLLRGMRALHGAWVVHRDLKMPNLLVSKHGVLKVR